MQPHRYKPKLNAGKLNRRITIQKKGLSEDAAGYPITNPPWEEVATVWASREPLRGREFFEAAAAQAEKTVRYKIRYRAGITSDMRLLDLKDNRIYEITVPLDDVFDDRTETHLMAIEVTNG
ncbi:phage head closure protein [Paenibacillus antarcticus]|uniref:Head-tail adaptor protein n=1 Tax=Paenibacillus antarcticus TaxID=253703 RepID=A0A168R192_9BACL|nr:phage head closure protein [Paenibacillus antarcticus]OAB48462.1 hypothetical protein PBAT_02185 [Paenibacillus antarcticus]